MWLYNTMTSEVKIIISENKYKNNKKMKRKNTD